MRAGKRLWLMWMIATGIGSLAAYFMGALAISFFLMPDAPPIIGWPLLELIGGFVAGATLGTLQWIILRPQVRHGQRWIWVTALGAAVALATTTPLNASSNQVLYGVLLGISLGIFQGLVLSHQLLLSVMWVLVSTLAWTVGMSVLCSCVLFKFVYEKTIPYEVLVLAAGAIAGSITGCMVVWLLRRSLRQLQSISKEQRSV